MAEIRYLEAKRTVDDRSLSSRVIEQLRSSVSDQPKIFEAGCGTGVTVPRLVEWGISDGSYLGVDTDPELIEYALRERTAPFDASFETGDALEIATRQPPQDLIIAQQFMDLVDTARALDAFTDALAPGGLAYFPLTFDGVSIFSPGHPADDEMIAAYHRSMDQRPTGDSRAGRHLAERLQQRAGTLLAWDSSDAIVRPREDSYPADEAFFLESILDFLAAEISTTTVAARDDWLSTRREQLDAGELCYVAHRYDLLYQTPA